MSFNGRLLRQLFTDAGSISETEHLPSSLPRHAHAEVSLCLVTRGVVLEGASEHLATDLIVRNAGEMHANTFGPRSARCFNVLIGTSLLPELSGNLAAAAPIVRRLRRELRSHPSPLVVEGLIYQLAGELSRPATSSKSVATRAYSLIAERFTEPLTIRAIAEEIEVHPVHLTRSFRSAYGITLITAIRDLRITYAASLLRAHKPIAQIAVESGFADQSHFTRMFRRVMGMTPRNYRNSSS
jgi:AraC family transcriptional regulator